jgi:hypothetical protein
MRNNKEFKILLEALDSSRLFRVGHRLTAQYVSECPGSVYDTDFCNIVLLLRMAKE